ncbi:MAG: hypothetical protein E6767_04605 [Dysgonomonas sp.]|nr:hypothetical protein [Dysgonomonas sp.]
MKTIYKNILIMVLGVVSLSATAQKDSTLIRQVMLERDYNPTLQDASKINTQPAIYSPVIKSGDFKFINTAPRLTLKNNQLGGAEPEDIRTDVAFDKKIGYINLATGSHSNLEGALGIRIVNEDRDRLDLFGTHSSTSGTVDYLQKGYTLEDVKAKYSASRVNLKYQHIFDPSIFSFNAGFYNTSYNYYGNTFIPSVSSVVYPFDLDSRQNVDVFSIGAGIKSSDSNDGYMKYMAKINYQNFKSKYTTEVPGKGPKGGQLDLDVDFATPLDGDKTVGVKGWLMNQSFSGNTGYLEDAYHGYTAITGTPYVRFQGSNWEADLGVNASAMFDVKTKLLFSPNLKASVNLDEKNTLYGELTGGVNNNTFLDILHENRYVNLDARIDYSKTLYDAKVGFKSGSITGFEFDIFGGYKKTDKDHLYLYRYGAYDDSGLSEKKAWGNLGTPLYANVGTGHIGGLIKTNLIPYTDLFVRMVGYFYNVKYVDSYNPYPFLVIPSEKKAWGRPTFTAELNADIKPIDRFTFSINYLLAGGRKTFFMNDFESKQESVNMKDINELNVKGEYQIADWVSVNVRANNILFQKYELQYGYPLQGFNVLGGLNFKF